MSSNSTFDLSDTSDCVLYWTRKDVYKHANTLKYLQYVDLSKGKQVFEYYEKDIWSHYDQVIINRKQAIRHLCFEFLSQTLKKHPKAQVVILAAGLDPLSLELASYFDSIYVLDMDLEKMDVKKQLLQKIQTQNKLKSHIECATLDISNAQLINEKLLLLEKSKHYDKNIPTLLIAEGISYYITQKQLWDGIKLFASKQKHNALILEYLLPWSMIDSKFVHIPKTVFQKIQEGFGVSNIEQYSEDKINKELQLINSRIEKSYSLKDIEYMRFKKNKLFCKDNTGWIKVSYSHI